MYTHSVYMYTYIYMYVRCTHKLSICTDLFIFFLDIPSHSDTSFPPPFLFLFFRHAREIWCTRRKHRTKLHTPNASGCEGFLFFSPLISGFVVLSWGFRWRLDVFYSLVSCSVYIQIGYTQAYTFCIYTIRYAQTCSVYIQSDTLKRMRDCMRYVLLVDL